jgi:hypothetical protein
VFWWQVLFWRWYRVRNKMRNEVASASAFLATSAPGDEIQLLHQAMMLQLLL